MKKKTIPPNQPTNQPTKENDKFWSFVPFFSFHALHLIMISAYKKAWRKELTENIGEKYSKLFVTTHQILVL